MAQILRKTSEYLPRKTRKKNLASANIVLGFYKIEQFQGFNITLLGGEKMAIIATICAVGTAIFAVLFSLWMLKELFTGN